VTNDEYLKLCQNSYGIYTSVFMKEKGEREMDRGKQRHTDIISKDE
jgi:hypothetical protein